MKHFFKGTNLFGLTRDKREQDADLKPKPPARDAEPKGPSTADFFHGSADDLRKKRKPN